MEIVRNGTVKIFGYLIPPTKFGQIKWYLTIREDRQGVLDREPVFRPEDLVNILYTHNCTVNKFVFISSKTKIFFTQSLQLSTSLAQSLH